MTNFIAVNITRYACDYLLKYTKNLCISSCITYLEKSLLLFTYIRIGMRGKVKSSLILLANDRWKRNYHWLRSLTKTYFHRQMSVCAVLLSSKYHLQLFTIKTYTSLGKINEEKLLVNPIQVANITIMFGNNLCLHIYLGKCIYATADDLAFNDSRYRQSKWSIIHVNWIILPWHWIIFLTSYRLKSYYSRPQLFRTP